MMSKKKKIYVIFPPYSGLAQQGLRLVFVKLPTYVISVSLRIEIRKKKACSQKTEQNLKFLATKKTFSESCCQILQTFSRDIIPDNTSFPLRYGLILNLYWLGSVQRVPLEQFLISKVKNNIYIYIYIYIYTVKIIIIFQ